MNKSGSFCNKIKMWLGPESKRRHADFQSAALPTELPSRLIAPGIGPQESSFKQKTPNAQHPTPNVSTRKEFASTRSLMHDGAVIVRVRFAVTIGHMKKIIS